ncbi:MAG: NUDIX domain-containing protein [Sphingomonadales bacterium]|nr:NUDIX domain-containing protein [Sphingomonadales bacterium]
MIPEFGERLPGIDYIDRPGAYAFIRDGARRLALMRVAPERHYLPGGGIEPGETPDESMAREIAEEMAHTAIVGRLFARATQYIASTRGGHFAVHAHYFDVTLGAPLAREPEHELLWLPPEKAQTMLVRDADRWALALFLGIDPA